MMNGKEETTKTMGLVSTDLVLRTKQELIPQNVG